MDEALSGFPHPFLSLLYLNCSSSLVSCALNRLNLNTSYTLLSVQTHAHTFISLLFFAHNLILWCFLSITSTPNSYHTCVIVFHLALQINYRYKNTYSMLDTSFIARTINAISWSRCITAVVNRVLIRFLYSDRNSKGHCLLTLLKRVATNKQLEYILARWLMLLRLDDIAVVIYSSTTTK